MTRNRGRTHISRPAHGAPARRSRKRDSDADISSAAFAALQAQADPERARHNRRFFKTGPGEYGEGDRFLGLTVPAVRRLVRQFTAMPLAQLDALLASEWHEARLLALLILVAQVRSRHATEATRGGHYKLYLARTARINNWDLVDCSAEHVVGAWLAERSRAPLRRLARSRSLWERRIAMLATFHFIKRGESEDALAIARVLRDDPEDLIHKAVGWMLREVGKRVDAAALRAFLDTEAPNMPRTMLRYAIEHFGDAERQHYLGLRNRHRQVID